MSYTSLLYHLIIRTKYCIPAINEENEDKLYGYLYGIARNRKSLIFNMNGMPDHVHVLISLSPEIALSAFMRELKAYSSKWIKESGLFPEFVGWGNGYGAFTRSMCAKSEVSKYIDNQKIHHAKCSLRDEYTEFMCQHGLESKIDFFFMDD